MIQQVNALERQEQDGSLKLSRKVKLKNLIKKINVLKLKILKKENTI